MKIIQIVPVISYGDAIGNDTFALDRVLKKMGFRTQIYAESIGKRIPEGAVRLMTEWEEPEKEDVILYHMALSFSHLSKIIDAGCRKIGIYHNITPEAFYEKYNRAAYELCRRGLRQVARLNDTFDYCLADSEFNRQDLLSYGYRCRIDVLPVLIPFQDYRQPPDRKIVKKYKGRQTNILFVGRVVPNKKQEDVIAAFSLYKKYFDQRAKLILAGSFNRNDEYCRSLERYIQKLGLKKDVIIPGHIRFDEILAYYASADLFLCMSEHEGFCVPLVEAMLFRIPIIAYDSSAVGETLGGSGVLLEQKNDLETAALMDKVIRDQDLRRRMIRGQRERLRDFRPSRIEKLFQRDLLDFLGAEDAGQGLPAQSAGVSP